MSAPSTPLRLGIAGLGTVGIGVVIAGPLIGDLVDRHGQRRVLVPVGLANGILLALFPLVVTGRMPEGVVLATALLIGLTAPQAAAMSRSNGASMAARSGRRGMPHVKRCRIISYRLS